MCSRVSQSSYSHLVRVPLNFLEKVHTKFMLPLLFLLTLNYFVRMKRNASFVSTSFIMVLSPFFLPEIPLKMHMMDLLNFKNELRLCLLAYIFNINLLISVRICDDHLLKSIVYLEVS
jgi:hypothetical protein